MGWSGEQVDCSSVWWRCSRGLVAILHNCWSNQLCSSGMSCFPNESQNWIFTCFFTQIHTLRIGQESYIPIHLMSSLWLQVVMTSGPWCDIAASKAHGIDWPWLHWVVCLPLLALQGTLFDRNSTSTL